MPPNFFEQLKKSFHSNRATEIAVPLHFTIVIDTDIYLMKTE